MYEYFMWGDVGGVMYGLYEGYDGYSGYEY